MNDQLTSAVVKPIEPFTGRSFVNLGCGRAWHPLWINVDQVASEHVIAGDITKPLSFEDSTIDAVYASHVYEHLDLGQAERFLAEILRVLKPGGIVRLVVPDLENIATAYLSALETVRWDSSELNVQRYEWLVLELLDQLVRHEAGGEMLKRLLADDIDREFIQHRSGDEFNALFDAIDTMKQRRLLEKLQKANIDSALTNAAHPLHWVRRVPGISLLRELHNRTRTFLSGPRRRRPEGPASKTVASNTGELHKWMYDSFSLARAVTQAGFVNVRCCPFNVSTIPGWDYFALDALANDPTRPRKPHSLYLEGEKSPR